MDKLPNDIMLHILSRLPHETIINCKPWRDITSDIKVGFIFQIEKPAGFDLCYGGDDITAMQGHYSYKTLMEIDDHPFTDVEPFFTMVGSCNGLVCFSVNEKSSLSRDPIYICNPITKEYVYLPTFNYKKACAHGKRIGDFNVGFGYHHSTNEYKVVRIYYHDCFKCNIDSCDEYYCGQVQAYTLGSGQGWRDIGTVNHHLDNYRGSCAYGALHWINLRRVKQIVVFDLADEEFRLIPFPPLSPTRGFSAAYLQLMFEGYVCVVHIDVVKEDRIFHVWALEKKKKVSSSYDRRGHDFNDFWRWTKKFSIPCTNVIRYITFPVIKRNRVLMSSPDATIFCYDLETQVLSKLWDNFPMSNRVAIPQVNSLVSLEALGEKSKRRK